MSDRFHTVPVGPMACTAALLAACAAPAPETHAPVVAGYAGAYQGAAFVVTRASAPFGYADGAEARRAADALCGGRVNSSTEDNFQGGAWIFPRGCLPARNLN